MATSEFRDNSKFIEFIKPSLEELGLQTDDKFINSLNEAYFKASKKLVHYRRDSALKKIKDKG